MKLEVREMQLSDIETIVDYFTNADIDFLKGMGVEKHKLPKKIEWIKILKADFDKSYSEKEFYYLIWMIDNEAVGHSNLNLINFAEFATMHLHLWKPIQRKSGLGTQFLRMTIPYYFKNFQLKKILCEPYIKNEGPNKTLQKVGFKLKKTYDRIPGWINFYQVVNLYELNEGKLKL